MTGCGRPEYPRSAIRARESGTTRIRLDVSESGSVSDVRLVASAGSSTLDDATIAALKACRFVPAHDAQGHAIASAVPLEYVWKLDPPPADSLATARLDHVPFLGPTAFLPHLREPALRKIAQAGGEADDCFDVDRISSRALPADYALPVESPADARELWIARQCGVARGYVVTLRLLTFPSEIRVWPVGPVAVDGPVPPLPTAASITDAAVRAAYDHAKALAGSEYHARQVLAASMAKAQEALDRIHAGEPFAQVAEQMSIDSSSAAKGGDLGWTRDRSQAASFGAALRSLAPHGLSRAPVHTEAGWHAIEVLGVRPAPYPDYDAIKDKLAETLRVRATDGL